MLKTLLASCGVAVASLSIACAEVPRVVTDIAPVTAIVASVMEGVGAPNGLVEVSVSPHDFVLRPSQARIIETGDLMIWVGPGLSPALERSFQALAPSAPNLVLVDDETADPHAWLDPALVRRWVGRINEELSRLDPANAATYRENAERLSADLNRLQSALAQDLADLGETRVWTYHDGLGVFAAAFGFEIAGALSDGDGHKPSAKQLSAMKADLSENTGCLLVEPEINAAKLKASLGVKIVEADILGQRIASPENFYANLMQGLARSLLGCR